MALFYLCRGFVFVSFKRLYNRPMDRTVLHVDMNNFYASVELLTRPDLADKPVIVGGDEAKRHGIVLAKNNLAKSYGVKTAETLYQALQKCPGAVVLPAQHDKYRHYSVWAKLLYREYSDRVESFGPDEAWIDVTELNRSGAALAHEIQNRVKSELGLPVSIGVSWNKTFAKMGSDYKKPEGITVISRDNYKDLLWPLPVGRLLFVGRVTAQRLTQIGIETVGELARQEPEDLRYILGKNADRLIHSARGEDRSPVLTAEEMGHQKSIGAMHTTDHDVRDPEDIRKLLWDLSGRVAERAVRAGLKGRTVSITVRYQDFSQHSRQRSTAYLMQDQESIFEQTWILFEAGVSENLTKQGARLLGVSLEQLEDETLPQQVSLADWAKCYTSE